MVIYKAKDYQDMSRKAANFVCCLCESFLDSQVGKNGSAT